MGWKRLYNLLGMGNLKIEYWLYGLITVMVVVFIWSLIFMHKKPKYKTIARDIVIVFALLAFLFFAKNYLFQRRNYHFNIEEIPAYQNEAYVEINQNIPLFSKQDYYWEEGKLQFSELDSLGRCGIAYAKLNTSLLPNKEREPLQNIKPSGWQTIRYDDLIADKYLYNRCHLIAYELSSINTEIKNLITGTRYLNLNMLPFENEVAYYLRKEGKPVLYRVTPVFVGDELVARGVLMEAESIEDDELSFCVYLYNVQPGIEIDYETGESKRK